MRIFITGASGFIGRNIVELLSSGSNKLLLLVKDSNERKVLEKYNKKIITGDLKNISYFKKDIRTFNPHVFIHLAWEGIPDFSFDMCKKNLNNSLTLVNFITNETDCKKIIVSGTCVEYGRKNGECKESDNINLDSPFAWAKYSLYCYLNFMCSKLNKDLIWFRIFYTYGPEQRKESLIPYLIYSFKNKIKPNIHNALNANDFIHVRDIAQAFKKAINKKISSGIYNLGSGKSTELIDICKIIKKTVNGGIFVSNMVDLKRDTEKTLNFWANMKKTEEALSWRPSISLEAGIKSCLCP